MMIKNEQEYHYSLECLRRFEASIAELEKNHTLKAEPMRWQLYRDSYQSQADELREEIAEYERLINCESNQRIQIQVASLNKLPDALIKARIAAKISPEELAEILGIEAERVKQYEETDYQCASFVELLEVSAALGVELETAVLQVDFQEIAAVKESVSKWRRKKINVASIKS